VRRNAINCPSHMVSERSGWFLLIQLGGFWVHCTEDVSLGGGCSILQAFGKVLTAGSGFLIPTPFRKVSWPVKELSAVGLFQAV